MAPSVGAGLPLPPFLGIVATYSFVPPPKGASAGTFPSSGSVMITTQ